MRTLAAAGAAAMIPRALAGQQRGVKLNVRGGAIDVHHHFYGPGMGGGNRPWTVERSLEEMEKFGIGVAILSMTQNGDLLYEGGEKGRSDARSRQLGCM